MTPIFWIGLAGMVLWGLVCSYYILRDKEITLTMMLPFAVFIALMNVGVE